MESNNGSSNFDSDSSSGNPDSTFVNVPDISSPVSLEEPESPGELVVPVPINGLSIDTRPRVLPSAPSSSNSSHVTRIFSKTYVYPDWVTKKHYKFFRRLQKRLLKLKYIHSHAATYFDKLNFYIFAPSITITAISSIGSFLSTASFIAEDTQNIFGISVGVLASGSAMLQSLASACKYNVKAESHRAAADEYDQLLTTLQFEMEMPNQKNFIDEFEKKILDVQNKCKYFPPQFIIDNYPGESDGEILPSSNRFRESESTA